MIVQENISLLPFNTFGIEVNAKYFCTISSKEELLETIAAISPSLHPPFFLGSGSNVLLCKDIDGCVIKNEIKGIEIINEDKEWVWIKSFSGTIWHDLVLYGIENNFGGIENMSLIPGTVGAAPIQNIGAYGVELKDTFVELEAIDISTGETKIFSKEKCQFGYRDSIFKRIAKGKYFIYSITLKLSKQPVVNMSYGDIHKVLLHQQITQPTIKDISNAIIEIRQSKLPDPKILGNAGSFFKNPEISSAELERLQAVFSDIPYYKLNNGKVKIPAGWLIEQCGWKGKQIGHTGNHAKQALVIVNYGNATGNEIWEHAQNVQQSIQQKFGIFIEAEVNIIR